jgi:ADP-ribosyl-[dinitrogen reductase] hydrolase
MASSTELEDRIRGAILGLAVCDALGAPVEFKARGKFPLVTEMLPNDSFDTPEGAFTDDTSMALCLAQSLLENEGKQNSVDQVEKYLAWRDEGYMSSVGYCFDIGVSTTGCLQLWQSLLLSEAAGLRPDSPAAESTFSNIQKTVREKYNQERYCGNGSLMRVLPVATIAADVNTAVSLAIESSMTTHPHPRCSSACALYVKLVFTALQSGQSKGPAILAENIAEMVQDSVLNVEEVLKSRLAPYKTISDWTAKPENDISSSGYVVDSLEASLWAFFTTQSFEEGAIRVVNLGDDADTIGAIYGGLAGAYYGLNAIPDRWLQKMKRMNLLQDIATKIVTFRQSSDS